MKRVIRITAIWCPSCIIMKKRYDDVLKDYDVELIDYDFDEDESFIKPYQIGSILPVVILMDENHEITRIIGEKNLKELKLILEGSLHS